MARSTFGSKKCQSTRISEHFSKLRCSKVHAVVAQSTFSSQNSNVQNLAGSSTMKNGPTLKIWHSPIPEFFCHVHFRCFKCFFWFCFVFFLCVCVFFFCFVFLVFLVFFSCVLLFFFYLPDVAVVPFWRGSVVSCAWQGFLSDVAVWCPVRGRFSFLTWQCGVLFMAVKKTRKKHTKKNRKRKEKEQDKQIHLKQSKMNVEEQLCRICRLHSTNPELGNVKF